MAHLTITLDDQILKELMPGDRDEAMAKFSENVFNVVLSSEETEKL